MRHYFNKGWAYKVDYDKAIADDERELAWWTSPIAVSLAALLTPALVEQCRVGCYCSPNNAILLLHYAVNAEGHPELIQVDVDHVLAILNLTRHDLAAIAYREGLGTDDAVLSRLCDGFTGPGLYQQGKQLIDRLEKIPVATEAERVKYAKLRRTRLATHKRNKAKHGGQ